MELWAAYSALRDPKDTSSLNLSPFINQREMYDKIDAIPIRGVPWQSLILSFDGLIPENPPPWMTAEHTVWFRDPRLLFKKMLTTQILKIPLTMHHIDNMICMANVVMRILCQVTRHGNKP